MFTIESTDNTPKVVIHRESGTIRIIGRAYPEHAPLFFDPINDELENITSDDIDLYFDFDYLNTSSTKCILFLIKNIMAKWDDIRITWVYEEGDEDILECGEDYEELTEIPFSFIVKTEG